MINKTHTLKATFRASNGRRMSKDFDLTAEQATDPLARSNAVSNASAYGHGRGWKALINWTIETREEKGL